MLLDNWLSQRALTCPNRCALIADGASLTYAQLEREATAGTRRVASAATRPSRCSFPPGSTTYS